MRESHRTSLALLSALLLLTAVLVAAGAEPGAGSPWALFEILEHSVWFQDISGDRLVYSDIGPPPNLTLLNIKSGETRVLEEFLPCGVPKKARIEGDWLVAEFHCSALGKTQFQSHVYNLETGETLLLAADPPDPELPYSWYVDINDGRVVWSQIDDCVSGSHLYLLDLETRDIVRITDEAGAAARMDLHLGPEWLVWDEFDAFDDVFVVHGANLTTGETITMTQENSFRGNVPLAGSDTIVWNGRTASGYGQIWAYDLATGDTYQIQASGDFPFAADLSGDLLVLSDRVDAPAEMLADQPAGAPMEPCELPRAGSVLKNRVRVLDLESGNDIFVYYNPEARYISDIRIDGGTVIWNELAGQYPDEISHVLGARRLDRQVYAPLVFR
ncbi:MAG: hypothetical protein PVJ75_01390 [Chloroflexota bacterium]